MSSIKHFLTAAILVCTTVNAHMQLTSPAPLKGPKNPNTKTADNDYTSPLSKSGSNYPCRGHLGVIGTPEGASVASWGAGSQQSFTIEGGAAHGGGSCQVAFSEDGGKTFKTVKSIVGGCPEAGKPYSFTVPAEIKAGPSIFAWTWFNQIGNREMYMNCAAVTITGSGGSGLSSYPDIFKANIGNGCTTIEGKDVLFPDPGKVVENNSAKSGSPVGNCGGLGSGPPGSSGSDSSGSSSYSGSASRSASSPASSSPTSNTTSQAPAPTSNHTAKETPTTAPKTPPTTPASTKKPYSTPNLSSSMSLPISYTSTTHPKCKCECNGKTISIVEF